MSNRDTLAQQIIVKAGMNISKASPAEVKKIVQWLNELLVGRLKIVEAKAQQLGAEECLRCGGEVWGNRCPVCGAFVQFYM